MVVDRYLSRSVYQGSRCCPLLLIGRIVVVVLVLIVAAVLAVRGYPPEEIMGPMFVLVAGAVTAADRLFSVGSVRLVSAATRS